MAKTEVEQIDDLYKKRQEVDNMIKEKEAKLLIKVGKLAKKHGLTKWNPKKLEKAFAFLAENQSNSFDINNNQPNE